MKHSHSPRRSPAAGESLSDLGGLGPALRRAWVGYQRRLDEAMAAAGFGDRGFPDGRVLRMCQDGDTTISDIGRELGITRQGASKIVAALHDRRYVTLRASTADAREKVVRLTPRAIDYLAEQRRAAQSIERRLRAKVGRQWFESLSALLEALGGAEEMRMRDYLRKMGIREM
jgi:DNA-binding MarR family transcriptional regulator